MESTGPHVVKLKKWIDCAPFEELLSMKIEEAKDGKAVLSMPFYYRYAQGAGLLHGGAIISLADTAVAMAIKSLLPEGSHFATIEVSAQFIKPVKKGVVKAVAEIYEKKERIFKGKAVVYDEENDEVLKFFSVFKLSRKSFELLKEKEG